MFNPVFKRVRVPPRSVELLLRAATAPEPSAWKAWQTWRQETDIETLKDTSICLLPYLYKRWGERIQDDTVTPVMKGVYRKTWYKNQMLLDQGRKVVEAFCSNGIQAFILKGMAATLQYYKDLGVRVLRDIDMHVPAGEVDRAADILKKLGFKYRDDFYSYEYHRAYTHGGEFFIENLGKIDLHWHILHDFLSSETDALFLRRGSVGEIGGVSVLLPDPMGLLVNTLHHNVRALPVADPRWILDAFVILEQDSSRLDWDFLTALSHRYPLLVPGFCDTLTYLHEVMQAPVPEQVLKKLRSFPVSRECQNRYEGILDSSMLHRKDAKIRNLEWIWKTYRIDRLRKSCGKPVSILSLLGGFLPYLKLRYRVTHYFRLLRVLISRYRQNPKRVWR